jgi:2-oxoglutarate ferredoxin oxidoreductase subunit alpha
MDGLKLGMLRLITIWPFPEQRVIKLAEQVKALVTVEINLGQLALEVERVVKDRTETSLIPNAGGEVHDPDMLYARVKEIAQKS